MMHIFGSWYVKTAEEKYFDHKKNLDRIATHLNGVSLGWHVRCLLLPTKCVYHNKDKAMQTE